MRWLRITLALAVLAGVNYAPGPEQARAGAAHFTKTKCPFKVGKGLVEGKDVRCGTIAVTEDHTHPTARTIQIPVAIFISHAASRKPDPVFSLQGGPGGAWISVIAPSIDSSTEAQLVGDRDLVVIDQRGTGFAKPSLACTPAALKTADPLKHTTPEQDVTTSLTVARQCVAELVARGIDLSVYTTAQDAADIDAVRAALGYQQINLYGVSYGTELVEVLMREFPKHIRSAVLDSVLPLSGNLFVDGVTNAARGLKQLFAGCAADIACNLAYPNLEDTFNQTVRQLDAHPVVIRGLDINTGKQMKDPYTGKPAKGLLTGQEFQGLITEAEHESVIIPYLPLAIVSANRGKYTLMELFAGNSIAVEKIVTTAMYYSVTCSEDAPFATHAQVAQAANALGPLFEHDALVSTLGELTLCRKWPVKSVLASFKQPLRSTIPTLLLEGDYDPITPLVNAKSVAAGLPTSYLFSFPGFGHGELFSGDCPSSIVLSFLDSPRTRPAATCIASLAPPKFVVPGN
jgi:pimeloyl-ACP methyl ester carboxylesterase